MNQKYWKEFYSKNHTLEPSPFAKYCATIIPKGMPILDLGCGNGRDSYFFGERGHKVLGLDYGTKPKDAKNVEFKQAGLTELFQRNQLKGACVYSRFFLHAITTRELKQLLDWTQGLFLAEMRSCKDDSFRADHRRKLIDAKKFLPMLVKRDFKSFTYQEAQGLAIYKKQDPTVIRITALK